MKFSEYLKDLQKYGRIYFTLQEAADETSSTKEAISGKIKHLTKKGEIISPFRGFYILIPLKMRHIGSLQPRDLVVICMKHLKIPYYVGLLEAARYHGATHQGLFTFHVVTSKRIKKQLISCQTRIKFIYKKDISGVKTKNRVLHFGYMPVSTPEETAKDVMTYYSQCGGLNHQATVLAELAEALNTKKLISLAKKSKSLFWVQRMGYILEHIDTFYEKERDRVVKALEAFISTQKLRYVPLAPEMPTKDKTRNKKWHIIENTTVESDV